MQEIVVKSFCKINIGLNIISKREDGYHNLQTIFYPISLADKITFRKSTELKFFSNSDLLNSEKNNLIIKAIELLKNYTGEEFNVEIFLEKNIPIGAGLGGGSSNAAFTLKAINDLFELKISMVKLKEFALTLGSDVPLFLSDLPAYAESRGEKLKKINLKVKHPILIIYPGIHISTKWAFSKISPQKSEINLEEVIEKYPDNYKIWQELINNDFERIVIEEFTEIKDLQNLLSEFGADFYKMSGSGSTFFAIFSNNENLYSAKKYFEEKNYFTYIEYPN